MRQDSAQGDGLDAAAAERDAIAAILVDVLHGVLGEEAQPVGDQPPEGETVAAVLAVHDETVDRCASVEVRVGVSLARVLAARMMFLCDPEPEDVLDAVAELGNICAGQVKTLLCRHARLSLPSADVRDGRSPFGPAATRVDAIVLGQVVELAVTPGATIDGLLWPPAELDDELERHA